MPTFQTTHLQSVKQVFCCTFFQARVIFRLQKAPSRTTNDIIQLFSQCKASQSGVSQHSCVKSLLLKIHINSHGNLHFCDASWKWWNLKISSSKCFPRKTNGNLFTKWQTEQRGILTFTRGTFTALTLNQISAWNWGPDYLRDTQHP